MVGALTVSRHFPASKEAARRSTAARSWYEVSAHARRALSAALTASVKSLSDPTPYSAMLSSLRCGERISAPEAPHRLSPPIFLGTSLRASVSAAGRALRDCRWGSPGAYWRTG